MTAQQHETVWTFYLSAGTATAGQVVGFNATRTGVLIATSANRTASGRPACGVAITSGDQTEPAIEVQVIGPLDPAIANVGAGSADEAVRVSTTGTLERVASPSGSDQVVGSCDADGAVYLNFFGGTGTGGGGGAAAHVAGNPGDVQVRAATGGDLAVPSFWTFGPDPSVGNLSSVYQANSANGGGITFRGTGGDVSGVPNIGLIRISDQLADNGGGNSITIAAFYSARLGGVQQAVIGVSGGRTFLGDASNPLTPIDLYGNANLTGIMGSAGFFFLTGSNYSSLGGTGKLLAIDGTGKVTVAGPGNVPPTVTIASTSIDWSLGTNFIQTLPNSARTFTFANSTDGQTINVKLTSGGGSSTVTWPTVKWKGGTPPTQSTSTSVVDVYSFTNFNGVIVGAVTQAMA